MRTLRTRVAATLALFAGLSFQLASAGLIFVSGDNNVTDSLSVGPNGNTVFFTNVLQGGTSVRVLDYTPGAFGSASNTDTELLAFYGGLPGVTAAPIAGTVTAASLVGVNLFLAPLPDDNFTAAEIAALQAFLAGGGTVFFLGENSAPVFDTGNAAINNALVALGSSLRLDPAAATANIVVPDPFTVGVTSLVGALASSRVVGGNPLFTIGVEGPATVAYEERFGPGEVVVPEPGTVALIALGLLALSIRRRKA